MTQPFRIRVNGDSSRRLALETVRNVPPGYVVEVREETRSDAQNRLLWPLLQDVSNQVQWAGKRLPPADWKNLFMGALESAEYVPSLDGKAVMPLGLSTRILSKAKFSDLIELIYAFGAERAVTFRTNQLAGGSSSAGAAGGRKCAVVADGQSGADHGARGSAGAA